jgi:hypothetical protein
MYFFNKLLFFSNAYSFHIFIHLMTVLGGLLQRKLYACIVRDILLYVLIVSVSFAGLAAFDNVVKIISKKLKHLYSFLIINVFMHCTLTFIFDKKCCKHIRLGWSISTPFLDYINEYIWTIYENIGIHTSVSTYPWSPCQIISFWKIAWQFYLDTH